MINAAEIGAEIDLAVALGLQAAAIEANFFISTRVFIEHKTTDGTPFGKYRSEAYLKYKRTIKSDASTKDLQLTGSLLRSVKQSENEVFFDNDFSAKVAKGQEEGSKTKSGKFVAQIGKPIFDLSQDEITDCIIECDEVFTRELLPSFDKIKIVI